MQDLSSNRNTGKKKKICVWSAPKELQVKEELLLLVIFFFTFINSN